MSMTHTNQGVSMKMCVVYVSVGGKLLASHYLSTLKLTINRKDYWYETR
jgi:hypothetical protein